jgi:WD40 repeat protein
MSPDDKWVVASGRDGSLLLIDVAAGSARTIGRHDGPVRALAWSADAKLVASAGLDRVILVGDVVSGLRRELRGHEALVRELLFSPDGERLVSAGDDNVIRIWDVREGLQRRILRGHTALSLTFMPDRPLLRSLGTDQTVRDWLLDSASESPPIARLAGWLERQTSAAVGPNETVDSQFAPVLTSSPRRAALARGSDRGGSPPAAPDYRTPRR